MAKKVNKPLNVNFNIGCVDCGTPVAFIELLPEEQYKGDQFYVMRCEGCQEILNEQNNEQQTNV